MAKDKKKTKKLKVDFGGVDKEIRKRSRDVPEGDYIFKVVNGEVKKNKSGDGRHILFSLQIVTDGRGNKKYAGVPKWYRCSLKPEALFNLRNFIFAVTGKNVAGKALNIDPKGYNGKKLAGTVENEGDGDKLYNSVVAVFPVSELETEEEEEDDDDDEEEEDEDTDDDDEDEEDDEDDDDDDDDLDDVDDDDL